jgi:hypothetical protein
LRKALRLYDEHEAKLILCLKLKFKVPFDIKDFQFMFEGFSHSDFIAFTQEIAPYKDASDLTVLTALTRIFNKYQNKNNTPDALRKWITVKTTEVIELLNGNPPTYFYTMETLQLLFEKCFCSEKDVVSKIY